MLWYLHKEMSNDQVDTGDWFSEERPGNFVSAHHVYDYESHGITEAKSLEQKVMVN